MNTLKEKKKKKEKRGKKKEKKEKKKLLKNKTKLPASGYEASYLNQYGCRKVWEAIQLQLCGLYPIKNPNQLGLIGAMVQKPLWNNPISLATALTDCNATKLNITFINANYFLNLYRGSQERQIHKGK